MEEGRAGEGDAQSSDQGAGAGFGPDQAPDGGGQMQDPGENRHPPPELPHSATRD